MLPVSNTAIRSRRELLKHRIRLLVAATIAYNVIEAVIALTEGTRASSAALFGFGLDSLIEVSSAAVVAWQFSTSDPEARERIALRLIAFSFFALAAYVCLDASLTLLGISSEAQHSPIGIDATSEIERSPSVTARLTGLSRAPLQAGHGTSRM